MARATKQRALTIMAKQGETAERAIARASLTPSLLAGSFLADLHKKRPDTDVNAFVAELQKHADDVKSGDLSRLEEMLATQAHTLDAMFYSLVNRSRANSAEGYLQAAETYMKLGLRAQAQCRATAESIATIKNPGSVAFVRQANISAGPQQVNNGVAQSPQPSRAEKTENAPSGLLEANDGERLDTRTPSTAGGADQELETVGALNRSEDAERQG